MSTLDVGDEVIHRMAAWLGLGRIVSVEIYPSTVETVPEIYKVQVRWPAHFGCHSPELLLKASLVDAVADLADERYADLIEYTIEEDTRT